MASTFTNCGVEVLFFSDLLELIVETQLLVGFIGCICNCCLVDFIIKRRYNDIVSTDIIEEEDY